MTDQVVQNKPRPPKGQPSKAGGCRIVPKQRPAADMSVRLSKMLTAALRHKPEQFGLTLDPDGSVAMTDLLSSPKFKQLRGQSPDSCLMVLDQDFLAKVRSMVSAQQKQRLQIFQRPDGTEAIRANYGHNARLTNIKVTTTPGQDPKVPEFLLHGTSSHAFNAIIREGLKPMGRQYVHAAEYEFMDQVLEVSQRHVGPRSWTVLLRIKTGKDQAWSLSADTWLCPFVPPECIDLLPGFGDATAFLSQSRCAGIIVVCPSQKLTCLVCTHAHGKAATGQWGFPKGKRHGHELTVACALRECQEETGLQLSDFETLLPPSQEEKLQEFSPKGNVSVQFLVGIVSEPKAVAPQDAEELAKTEWVSLDVAGTLLTSKNRRDLLDSAMRLVCKAKPVML